jgi:hypothetical protein
MGWAESAYDRQKLPPNKKPIRPANGFLKTAKTRVPSLKIGSEKDLE